MRQKSYVQIEIVEQERLHFNGFPVGPDYAVRQPNPLDEVWFVKPEYEGAVRFSELWNTHTSELEHRGVRVWENDITGIPQIVVERRLVEATHDTWDDEGEESSLSWQVIESKHREAVREAYAHRQTNGCLHAEGVAHRFGVSVYQVRDWCGISLDAEDPVALMEERDARWRATVQRCVDAEEVPF